MSIQVGITGGIGSGKSLATEIFKTLGIPVYLADDRGKHLLANDPEVIEEVKDLLGESVYQDGLPDRKEIAKQVFGNAEKLAALNAIIHPAVARDFDAWLEANATAPYVLKEAAILLESGSYESLDKLILVTAPEDLRMKRVMARDGVAEAEVRARMNRQWSDEQKLPYADFVLVNDGQQMLIPAVLGIHKQLLAGLSV